MSKCQDVLEEIGGAVAILFLGLAKIIKVVVLAFVWIIILGGVMFKRR